MQPRAPRPLHRGALTRLLTGLALVGVLVPLAGAGASAQGTASGGVTASSVGTEEIAAPASGGRTIYVSVTGKDKVTYAESWGDKTVSRYMCLSQRSTDPVRCPAATVNRPLRSVQAAIRSALPGDVLVVREGVYQEAVGWGAVAATSTKPIVLQAYPGERAEVNGTLMLRKPSYWTVRGFHFTYNREVQGSGQAIVNLQGGTGWTFADNEVKDSPGVANIMITPGARSGSEAVRRAAGPRDYTISGNCIHDNRGRHTHGMDHNIYLMAGIYSTGGLIERNLLAGAPNGSQIKVAAAGAATAADSPRGVTIRKNTMLNSSTGVVVGLAAQWIRIEGNLVANQAGAGPYDAAVKGWELKRADLVTVKGNLLAGYKQAIREETGRFNRSANTVRGAVSYSGSIQQCTAVVADAGLRAQYGHAAR